MSAQDDAHLAEYILERMHAAGLPTSHALAKAAGISPDTMRHVLLGSRVPSERTLERIAEAIGGSLPRMRLLAGQPRGEAEPFILPPEANQLTMRQRQVVLSMISALLNTPDPAEDENPAGPVADQTRSAPRLVGRLRNTDSGST